MALLAVFPDPNLPVPQGSNNWIGVAGSPTSQRKYSTGVDTLSTNKDSIRFRAALFHYFNLSPFQTNFLFSGRAFDRPNQTASVELDPHFHADVHHGSALPRVK